MKGTAIKRENVNREHAASIITTNVQHGIPWLGHNPEISSPFVSLLINNCLLYTRPENTQMMQ